MIESNQQVTPQSLIQQNSLNNVGMTAMPSNALAAELVSGKIRADEYLHVPDMQVNQKSELNLTQHELNKQYLQQLQELSPCKDTLPLSGISNSDWARVPEQEVLQKRIEFNEIKTELKEQWSVINKCEWPQYQHDVYSDKGNLIRRAGNDYDAHHIRPLCLGGENTAENLTPLHAADHYDRQGIHASGSPIDLMTR